MSCSQFVENEDGEDKNDTLVIIVNGNGTVSVDPLTLERVLTQQCRAAVGVIRFENTDEPDSQTGNTCVDENESAAEEKGKSCRKVNLVIEGYYPATSSNMTDKNIATESVVSSTVGTPPLPPSQNSSDFLDLLSEGLEIPVPRSPNQSNVLTTTDDGGIGDSLVDAFSEMAPEQLKQVETALHSEKAKQILGDDVTSVIDTFKLNDEHDDWVHFDHCYTNIYGNKKSYQSEQAAPNAVEKDCGMATMLTIKVGANDEYAIRTRKDGDLADTSRSTAHENLELTMPENVEVINLAPYGNGEVGMENVAIKKKNISLSRPKLVTGGRVVSLKGNVSYDVKEPTTKDTSAKKDRLASVSSMSQTLAPKTKKRSKENSAKNEVALPERIVTEDEVNGVKVFKPTRNDKRTVKLTPLLSKEMIQSKLNFSKKLDSVNAGDEDATSAITKTHVDPKEAADVKNTIKKETGRKSSSLETFGPALFSTPDIIRKINAAESDGDGDGNESTSYLKDETISGLLKYEYVDHVDVDEQTADIEKRMSALENGEAILDQLHLQVEMQKEMERVTSQSDDDKLLSDLENSADEDQQARTRAAVVAGTPSFTATKNFDLDSSLRLDLEDLENESHFFCSDSTKSDDRFDRSAETETETEPELETDGCEKDDGGEYEDDPNKLWCLCNKPHNNRFMICCDACDNWFHGKCVGISKATGEKMEQDGTEWLCPNCKKEKFAKERENKSKLPTFTKSTASRLASRHGRNESFNVSTCSTGSVLVPASKGVSGENEPSVRKKSWNSDKTSSGGVPCVQCKEKEAMTNAVYCSAECVSTYVTNSLNAMNNRQRIPLSEDRRIIVVDRKNGHRISGFQAPIVGSLREWLLRNPCYEIDRPSALPACRPDYSSTFTKPTPPKKQGGSLALKSKEILVVPVKQQHQQSPNHPNDSMTQISMKQFVVKRPNSGVAASGDNENKRSDDKANVTVAKSTTSQLSSSSLQHKKDDFKSKEKQRQIKLIPIQPLTKVNEESRDTKVAFSQTAKKLPSTCGVLNNSGTTDTSNASPSPLPSPLEKKKKPETVTQLINKEKTISKKTEAKRCEVKKKDNPNESSTPTALAPAVPTSSAAALSSSSLSSGHSGGTSASATVSNSDAIRASVRKGLNELFVNKMKESPDIKLSEEEICSLASLVEEEIYLSHNKDTGSKYKNKYRRLLFNIKEPQNTLFRRIVNKSLSPYELVRLTADELACTELAEWRQREAKHEIEMIKKTELENLQQSKVLVLKTHKGELEIESARSLPPCEADLIVPDLRHDDASEEKDKINSAKKSTLPFYFSKDKERNAATVVTSTSSSSSGKTRSKNEAVDKKENEDRDGKDKRRKHRDRDRKSSTRRGHRSSERDKRRSRSHRRSSTSPDKQHQASGGSATAAVKSSRSHRSRSSEKDSRSRTRSKSRSEKKEKCDERKDKQRTSPEVAAATVDRSDTQALPSSSQIETTAKDLEQVPAELLNPFKSVDVDLSDMEPSSTVTIKTPPYSRSPDNVAMNHAWKGVVVMPDVVRFHVALKEVSGNCEGLDDDLQPVVDCVGRIHPTTVWDYISKVKKSGNKEILVLRFESVDAEDRNNYLSFYSYLSTKNRMAVVGNTGPAIKDFYVMPLASHSPIPQVLLPLDGPGFEDSRPHLLLAVIVRSRRKKYNLQLYQHHHHHHSQPQPQPQQRHHFTGQPSQSDEKTDRESHLPAISSQHQTANASSLPVPIVTQQDSFTPPHSPTSVFVQTPRIPITSTAAETDENEPYSPEDEECIDIDVAAAAATVMDLKRDIIGRGDNHNDEDDREHDTEDEDEDDDGGDGDYDDANGGSSNVVGVEADNGSNYDQADGNNDDDDDEPYSPSRLHEEHLKSDNSLDSDNCCIVEDSEHSGSGRKNDKTNDADRAELYSPSEHFFNDIESSEVTLPAIVQKLLNKVKNRRSESPPACYSGSGDGSVGGGTILEADPIVDAYKKGSIDDSDEDDADDTVVESGTIAYSPSPLPSPSSSYPLASEGERELYVQDEKSGGGNGADVAENVEQSKNAMNAATAVSTTTTFADENKTSRDPRRKAVTIDSYKHSVAAQPPPPGMEDEFGGALVQGIANNEANLSSCAITAEAGYSTQVPIPTAAVFPYANTPVIPSSPYTTIMPQMYLASSAVYPPTASLPFTAMAPPPPPQIYVPPPPPSATSVLHRNDPSLIPLPVDAAPVAKKSSEKRKADDEKEYDKSDKRSDLKSKKHKSYYTSSSSDSKSMETKSSPNRHHSSGYDSHRRGYQRDDVEYGAGSSSGGGSSRYGGHSGSSRSYRDRGGYWKSGSDYSSSSHKRYSHSSSGEREHSGSTSKRTRWEGSKYDHDDWNDDSKSYESRKDREKSEMTKKSEPSRRS